MPPKTSDLTLRDLLDRYGITPRTTRFYESAELVIPRAGECPMFRTAFPRTSACLDCAMNVIGALVLILMVLFACHQVAHLPDRARAACPTAAC